MRDELGGAEAPPHSAQGLLVVTLGFLDLAVLPLHAEETGVDAHQQKCDDEQDGAEQDADDDERHGLELGLIGLLTLLAEEGQDVILVPFGVELEQHVVVAELVVGVLGRDGGVGGRRNRLGVVVVLLESDDDVLIALEVAVARLLLEVVGAGVERIVGVGSGRGQVGHADDHEDHDENAGDQLSH